MCACVFNVGNLPNRPRAHNQNCAFGRRSYNPLLFFATQIYIYIYIVYGVDLSNLSISKSGTPKNSGMPDPLVLYPYMRNVWSPTFVGDRNLSSNVDPRNYYRTRSYSS